MLVGELADIMEEIEIENKDFKKNVLLLHRMVYGNFQIMKLLKKW